MLIGEKHFRKHPVKKRMVKRSSDSSKQVNLSILP